MKYLSADIRHKCRFVYETVNWKTMLRTFLTDGTSAMILFRISNFFQRNHLGILGMIFSKINYHWNAIVIGQGASFGKGFVILHSVAVVINGAVEAGENLVIEHGVTIGAEKYQIPKIGNNVFLGAGSKVIGAVSIGDNVKIGANAVVVKDIPENSTAVGIPAKVIKKNGQ